MGGGGQACPCTQTVQHLAVKDRSPTPGPRRSWRLVSQGTSGPRRLPPLSGNQGPVFSANTRVSCLSCLPWPSGPSTAAAWHAALWGIVAVGAQQGSPLQSGGPRVRAYVLWDFGRRPLPPVQAFQLARRAARAWPCPSSVVGGSFNWPNLSSVRGGGGGGGGRRDPALTRALEAKLCVRPAPPPRIWEFTG